MKRLVDAIEISAMYGQGTLAARPVSTGATPGKQGRIYDAADVGAVYWDYGTGWQPTSAPGIFTTAQRNAFLAGSRPAGLIIWNSDASRLEVNAGTDAAPNWQPVATTGSLDINVWEPLDYAQITAPVTVSGTSEAGATTIVTGAALAYDGNTRIRIEFFSPEFTEQTTSQESWIVLYQDGVSIGPMEHHLYDSNRHPVTSVRELTPSAGTHTYSIRAYQAGSGQTVVVGAGAGGSGVLPPAFLRISRIKQQTYSTPAGTVTYGTALPATPADGQEHILVDSTTNPTWQWRFRYNSTTTKWHYLGGTPLRAFIGVAESTASLTYGDLATIGPAVTVPLAGDYQIESGVTIVGDNGTDNPTARGWATIKLGAAVAADSEGIHIGNTRQHGGSVNRCLPDKTLVAAAVVLMQYRAEAIGSWTFSQRWLRVTPVKVG
jgi:hypothetical protein